MVATEMPRKALCAFSFIHGEVLLALFVFCEKHRFHIFLINILPQHRIPIARMEPKDATVLPHPQFAKTVSFFKTCFVQKFAMNMSLKLLMVIHVHTFHLGKVYANQSRIASN